MLIGGPTSFFPHGISALLCMCWTMIIEYSIRVPIDLDMYGCRSYCRNKGNKKAHGPSHLIFMASTSLASSIFRPSDVRQKRGRDRSGCAVTKNRLIQYDTD